MNSRDPIPSTFSIVACDLDSKEWGVAVQSKFLGVGAVVPWARADVGAVATQARANTAYGPGGLALLEAGKSAREAAEELTGHDERADVRQLGIVDSSGRAFAFTGKSCTDWAGHETGCGFTCQGNILAGPQVVVEMARGFREGRGDLAERMLQALLAGQAAGGDRRGKQSAAILVARGNGGYAEGNDRYIDLRVEDHPEPIPELVRLVDLHRVYFLSAHAGKIYPFRGPTFEKARDALTDLGLVKADAPMDAVYREVMRWGEDHGLTLPASDLLSHDILVSILKASETR